MYQDCLGCALVRLDALVVGRGGETVVVDETVVGLNEEDGWATDTKGISKRGARQARLNRQGRTAMLVKKGVLKRAPARTIYRTQEIVKNSSSLRLKPVAANTTMKMSKKPAVILKKPSANLKNNGKWLWLAVEVGKGNVAYTHKEKTKRFAYRLLPRRADAKDGAPRGSEEISGTLHAHVAKQAFLVHDGWSSTVSAVEALGYRSAPPVVHEDGYRDRKTGFHTNDVESENARLKLWNRHRYGKLQLNRQELDEYVFYANIGGSMSDVLGGLAVSNGGAVRNFVLK